MSDLLQELKRRDRDRAKEAEVVARDVEEAYWETVKLAADGVNLDEEGIETCERAIEHAGRDLDQFAEHVALFRKYLKLKEEKEEADAGSVELNRKLEEARKAMLDKARFLKAEGVPEPLRMHPSGFYSSDSPSLRAYVNDYEALRAEQDAQFSISKAFREVEIELRQAKGQDVRSGYGEVSKYAKMGQNSRKIPSGRGTEPGERSVLLGDGRLQRIPSKASVEPREQR